MQPLILYNTLTRKKEIVTPLGVDEAELREEGHREDRRAILLYTCGPTVYAPAHVGNLRALTFFDILRRGLDWLGYRVEHVMNITDVDDKTIRDSRAAGVPLFDFTRGHTKRFLLDMGELNVREPHLMPPATGAIAQMVELVEALFEKGVAYRGEDRSIYFKIAAFESYGALSQLDKRTLQAGAGGRVEADEYDKDNVQDFALWKAWTLADGDVYWDTSLGRGRPGWHLECSALAMMHLDESIDIHAGGIDLVFPHHENEIAQSEAVTGKPFSRFWAHNEHLVVGGKKMSKSLNNFYTYAQLGELAGASGREVRYALIADAHYRKQLNLQVSYVGEGELRRPVRFDAIEKARESLKRLDEFRRSLGLRGGAGAPNGGDALLERVATEFRDAIADDLNVPKAMGRLFELVREVNKLPDFDAGFGAKVGDLLDDFDEVLGFLQPEQADLDPEEQQLFDRWLAAREAGDWPAADEIRSLLNDRGIQVQARKGESTWTRR
ncbi:MAG: cysteine--tRNA ligase [Myxococcota bacterium]